MKIEVLGCFGGEAPGCRTTCLLINDSLAIDAGSLAQALPIERQVEVRSVVLTHAHADHTRSLPFFVENVHAAGGEAVDLYASQPTLDCLDRHLFNGACWPDFTGIPDRHTPALRLCPLAVDAPIEVEGVRLTPVAVDHSAGTVGLLIEQAGRAVLWSSDTGPTTALWRKANATPDLQAIWVETSFPDAEQELADLSMHLTPATLRQEIDKLERPIPLLVHHMKPGRIDTIRGELERLAVAGLEPLEQGEIYTF